MKKKKIAIILTVSIVIIVAITIIQTIIYSKDLKECYQVMKENGGNWYRFDEIVDRHPILKDFFEEKAYQQLYKVMDEEIEEIKKGNYDIKDESFKWISQDKLGKEDKKEKSDEINKKYRKEILEKRAVAETYKVVNEANKLIESGDYAKAYSELENIHYRYYIYDMATNIATQEQKSIEDKAIKQSIEKAQQAMKQGEYSMASIYLKPYKDLQNDTVTNLYNTCEKKIKEQEEREEKEEIEKEKKDFEIYCYFNMTTWNNKSLNDEQVFARCASKFGISKKQAKEAYERVVEYGWAYQDKYPQIFEKYRKQYK